MFVGLIKTRSRHEGSVNRHLHNRPAVTLNNRRTTITNNQPDPIKPSSNTKNTWNRNEINELESVIEKLDSNLNINERTSYNSISGSVTTAEHSSPKSAPSSRMCKNHTCSTLYCSESRVNLETSRNLSHRASLSVCTAERERDRKMDKELCSHVTADTLAVISEFETMTRELLYRRPSINFHL